MKTLVVFALLGCVCASPFVRDTPEVVAERARFQQLYNTAAAAAAAAPDPAQGTGHYVHQSAPPAPAALAYQHQPSATPTYHHQPSVPASWQQAAAPWQQATASWQQPAPAPSPRWSGPVAATVGAGVGGQIIPVSDTADVTAARNAFFASYNTALAATRPVAAYTPHQQPAHYSHQHTAHQQPAQYRHHPNTIQAPSPKWRGPVAATVPAGLPGSVAQVPQTADVAAATAAFQQAYSAAVAATTGRRY